MCKCGHPDCDEIRSQIDYTNAAVDLLRARLATEDAARKLANVKSLMNGTPAVAATSPTATEQQLDDLLDAQVELVEDLQSICPHCEWRIFAGEDDDGEE